MAAIPARPEPAHLWMEVRDTLPDLSCAGQSSAVMYQSASTNVDELDLQLNLPRVVKNSRVSGVGPGLVASVLALIIIAGAAGLCAAAQGRSSSSPNKTDLYEYTNYGNSTSVSTTSAFTTTYPNAVYVYVPYGGGENDDGATNFLPQIITVVIGVNNTVTWTNQDLIAHNVISNTGAFYSGDLSTGQSYTFTFTQPGTYPYYCSYHPMNGEVVVENPGH